MPFLVGLRARTQQQNVFFKNFGYKVAKKINSKFLSIFWRELQILFVGFPRGKKYQLWEILISPENEQNEYDFLKMVA